MHYLYVKGTSITSYYEYRDELIARQRYNALKAVGYSVHLSQQDPYYVYQEEATDHYATIWDSCEYCSDHLEERTNT